MKYSVAAPAITQTGEFRDTVGEFIRQAFYGNIAEGDVADRLKGLIGG